MSERAGLFREPGAGPVAQSSLLDRLIDQEPDKSRDASMSPAESLAALRRSVRRDLEALLNTRRRWRSWPDTYTHLARSPLGYGIADFSSGAFNNPRERERLRYELEEAIRLFEPRLTRLRVRILDPKDPLEATLRLRIEGLLCVEPAPDPIAFDTFVDTATTEVVVKPGASYPLASIDDV
jgi:type VI secretion system protein ImpF